MNTLTRSRESLTLAGRVKGWPQLLHHVDSKDCHIRSMEYRSMEGCGDTEHALMPSAYKACTPWSSACVGLRPLDAQQCPVRIHAGTGNGDLPLCSTSSPAAAWLWRENPEWTGKKKSVIFTFLCINKGYMTMVKCMSLVVIHGKSTQGELQRLGRQHSSSWQP